MQNVAFIKSNDGNLTIVVNNNNYSVSTSHPNYAAIIAALKGRKYDVLEKLIDIPAVITAAYGGNGVTVQNGQVFYGGNAMHNTVCDRILAFIQEGLPHMPLVRFLENLMENPSSRAVNELYDFLEHKGFPITEDGCFIGYKGVRADYTDKYSGTFDNTPNITEPRPGLKMPKVERNQVDDDRTHECSWGLHVGTLEYARGYSGERVVLVKVNPREAVSVPKDHDASKLRVSEYKSIGDAPQERIDTPMFPMPQASEDENAFEQGETAFVDGRDIDSNPYPVDTTVYYDWEEGWYNAAQDEDEDDEDPDIDPRTGRARGNGGRFLPRS